MYGPKKTREKGLFFKGSQIIRKITMQYSKLHRKVSFLSTNLIEPLNVLADKMQQETNLKRQISSVRTLNNK